MSIERIPVRLLKSISLYNAGEIAGFTKEQLKNFDPSWYTTDLDPKACDRAGVESREKKETKNKGGKNKTKGDDKK